LTLPADRQQEAELARQILAGSPDAFDRFVDHFRTKVFQYTWLMCGQREDAEEVAQDTLLKVFENFGQLREPERVRPWVFRIAKNACLTKRRKSIFAPEPSQELSLDALMPSGGDLPVADSALSPEKTVLQAEVREALEQAIQALPDLYRPVLLLRDVEGLSTEETAGVLGISEDAVKTRLHRARLAVRKHLATLDGARP
jgi:RNA polymerase sigma-70 factor (ECF subfamily)